MSDDSTRKRPIMVHRAIFGSIERFFGILVENTAGDFPLWLSPVQMRLLPVTDKVRSLLLPPGTSHLRCSRSGVLLLRVSVCLSF